MLVVAAVLVEEADVEDWTGVPREGRRDDDNVGLYTDRTRLVGRSAFSGLSLLYSEARCKAP